MCKTVQNFKSFVKYTKCAKLCNMCNICKIIQNILTVYGTDWADKAESWQFKKGIKLKLSLTDSPDQVQETLAHLKINPR